MGDEGLGFPTPTLKAVREEAQAVVYDKINRTPIPPNYSAPEWKTPLFKAVEQATKSNPSSPTGAVVFKDGQVVLVTGSPGGSQVGDREGAVLHGGAAQGVRAGRDRDGRRDLQHHGIDALHGLDCLLQLLGVPEIV